MLAQGTKILYTSFPVTSWSLWPYLGSLPHFTPLPCDTNYHLVKSEWYIILSVWIPSVGWLFLYRQIHLTGTPCLYQLYKSLVLPTLDYCSSVWDPSSALYTDKLESVQDFATKVITNQWNTPYDDRLRLLNLPRLSTRRMRQKFSSATELWQANPLYFLGSLHPTCVLTCVITTTCHYTIQVSELLPINPLFQSVLFHSGTLSTVTLCPLPVVTPLRLAYPLMCL